MEITEKVTVMSNNHSNGDCGCKKSNCPQCTESYTLQKDCCNSCGATACCQDKCGQCNEEGPQPVTNEELNSECSWFWVTINRNCCQQPVRIGPNRLKSFIFDTVDLSDLISDEEIEAKICEILDPKINGLVTNAQYVALSAKVNKNCQDIATINQWIANFTPTMVDLTGYATEAWVNEQIAGLGSGGLDETAVNLLINTALENYYTRTQVNNLIAGLQEQINTLQAQLSACDCGGGSAFTPPTADFDDILTNECPASVMVAAIADTTPTMQYTYSSTGTGTVVVRVNGSVVTNPFTVPAGQSVEVEVNGADDANHVGVVTIEFDDGEGNTGIVDGVQYDITCQGAVGGGEPTIVAGDELFTIRHGQNGSESVADNFAGATSYSLDVSGANRLSGSGPATPAGLININGTTGQVTYATSQNPMTEPEYEWENICITATNANGSVTNCGFTLFFSSLL